jgi:biopolymer transport protein ExbD
MKINLDAPTEEVRIEIIPLIDVIFCILTFFILAAVGLTRQLGINVDLPQASTGSAQMREMLVVSVDPIGQTYVEQQPVSPEQLTGMLLDYRLNSPDGLVVLYASRSASYASVVSVLDLLRSVGGDRVALATLPESAEGSAPSTPGFNLDPNQPLPSDDPFAAPSDPFGTPSLPGDSGAVDPFELDDSTLFPESAPSPDSPNGGESRGESRGESNTTP